MLLAGKELTTNGSESFKADDDFLYVGHYGLGRFGPDISARDVSATENAKGRRFGQNHKLWVGVCACIKLMCDAFLRK